MPMTQEQPTAAERFRSSYPPDLASRFDWFVRAVGLDKSRLLRLLGFSPEQAATMAELGWDQILTGHIENALWAEEVVLLLLRRYDYDWEQTAEELRGPLDEARFAPAFWVTFLGGRTVRLQDVPRAEWEPYLLPLIARRAADHVWAVFAFFSHAETGPAEGNPV